MLCAKPKGFSRFDFGLSAWDQEGLLNFKRKFADEEKTISFLVAQDSGIPIRQRSLPERC